MSDKGAFLQSGDRMEVGDFLVSKSRLFNLVLQRDGNLCVYRGSRPIQDHGAIWCAGSTAPGGTFQLSLDDRGRLELHSGTSSTHVQAPIWTSGRAGKQGIYRLVMQDDGNLCIYRVPQDKEKAPKVLWCSGATDKKVLHAYLADSIPKLPAKDLGGKIARSDSQLSTGVVNRFRRLPPGDIAKAPVRGPHGVEPAATDSVLQCLLFGDEESVHQYFGGLNVNVLFSAGRAIFDRAGAAGVIGGLFVEGEADLLEIGRLRSDTLGKAIQELKQLRYGRQGWIDARASKGARSGQLAFALTLEQILVVKGLKQTWKAYVHNQAWIRIGRTYGLRNRPGSELEPAKDAHKDCEIVELTFG